MSSTKKIIQIIIYLMICQSCTSFKSPESTKNAKERSSTILFIGNSLTYTNDLPKLVKVIAKEKGVRVTTTMIALPNYALIDHWNDGTIQKEIRSKQYDFVIVQQGPSSQAFGKEILVNYGKKYSNLCEENSAQLCYFMVWPSLTYYNTFDGVIKNHREAARINNAMLLPVGEIWKTHFDATENFDYYSNDGFHPSLKGSRVAAEIIVDYLFKK
ncbi:SGNH/GDSL hydrolase family protein [uncultured Winogradskyella sp.]|uniref:SGNH/GDSL hydrolase family protein n=1 Tax=uncultured Winogradskyella sp. TaxID=395353 RepID=UPI002608FDC1|nr:SGNH/GDSL hydrolase family protein [uncultured Winogradskyella sp.]